ncbi:MAG: flagellar biosynthetic protein FliR, partial [Proteobacteria bacterium]|nr:flagellar biosynthetic protein FliR [Pseudomonadota bacterium]
MLTFSEAQLTAWLTPILWPFLRVLALFTSAPVLSMRSVPVRVKLALSFLVALAAQAVLPAAPAIALDDPAAFGVVLQQVGVGITMGFAARIVFAAIEFAGELIGLQMGLNYAGFFDSTSDSSATASARLFGTMASWLFIVINGHL